MYSLYTDGGSRGNPGPSGIGICCFDDNNKELFRIKKYIGETTNNQAEYVALIEGLKKCVEQGIKSLECFADSELMVKQLKGEYKMKNPGLKLLFDQVKILSKEFESISFNHILREKNKIADSLVNEALDEYLA